MKTRLLSWPTGIGWPCATAPPLKVSVPAVGSDVMTTFVKASAGLSFGSPKVKSPR